MSDPSGDLRIPEALIDAMAEHVDAGWAYFNPDKAALKMARAALTAALSATDESGRPYLVLADTEAEYERLFERLRAALVELRWNPRLESVQNHAVAVYTEANEFLRRRVPPEVGLERDENPA